MTDAKEMSPFEVHIILALDKIAAALEKLIEVDSAL
jgi:hypothetical protein